MSHSDSPIDKKAISAHLDELKAGFEERDKFLAEKQHLVLGVEPEDNPLLL